MEEEARLLTNIEKRRLALGISRSELSRQSGVPLITLEKWASHQRIPRDVFVLRRIASVFGCTIEDIMEPEPKKVSVE